MRTPKADKRYYFAYGSNCNLGQMAYRCPRARKIVPVTLEGWKLTFNGKHSGVGVASIKPEAGAEVNGLLWAITPSCEASLDIYEGYPHLYIKEFVTVKTENGAAYKAMVYVMTDEYNTPALPSSSYYEGIYKGFKENGIDTHSLRVALAETYDALSCRKGVG